MANEILPKS